MNLVSDKNLEETALKAIIDHPTSVAIFTEDMFAAPHTSIIFDVIKSAYRNSEKIDKSLLISRLLQREVLDVIGGEGIINSLFNCEYEEDLIEDYSQRLKDISLKRYMQIALFQVVKGAGKADLSELFKSVSEVQDTVLERAGVNSDEEDFSDIIQQEIVDLINRDKSREKFIKTNFDDYDALIGGVEKSNLEIIAARPSMGKTSLMLRWFLNFAKRDVPVEIISFEMSNQQLSKRIISMESGIPGHRIDQKKVTDNEIKDLKRLGPDLRDLPIHISYKPVANITDIVNHIRLAHRNKGIEVFGIDYIQLMSVKEGRETQGYANIARALKSLAVELDIVIVLLSQLNRSVEHRRNKRPILSDLRQSGGLEENADKVIFIYREYMYYPEEQNRGHAEIIIGKNRNGPTATFNFMFDSETTNFYTLG
jgi:replicative DNA helicase